MDFSFTEEQEMLRRTARAFLDAECPKSLVREMVEDEKGYSPKLWRQMAKLGWMGLVFPPEYGGIGGSFLDLVVLLEEMGRACLPGPFFSAVVLGGLTILEAGNEQQKRELLPKLAKGDIIITLALTEPQAKYAPSSITVKAVADGNDYVIHGTKLFVPDAHIADYIVCVAKTRDGVEPEEGITLFLVDVKSPGVGSTLLKTIAGDKQCEVTFNKVRVPKENKLVELHQGWVPVEKILQKAAIAKCAEMIGGARQVVEMTVDYAKQRVQFGQPIGSFQAVQHHCANMLIDVEGSKYITYEAAWMLSKGMPCNKQVAMAKAWVSEAYRRVTALGHQVIGGVAFMEDHDMPLYSKRAKAAEVTFGDADFHVETVAQELGL